jgi:hypothetical protein
MIEAFRDPGIIEAEIASQCRRRPAQIVRREWPQAEQRADPGRRSVYYACLRIAARSLKPQKCTYWHRMIRILSKRGGVLSE